MVKALALFLACAGITAFLFREKPSPPEPGAIQARSVSFSRPVPAASESGRQEVLPREQELGRLDRLQNMDLLLSESGEMPDLCRLRCEQIKPALSQMQAYQAGASPPLERDDPAYLLAKLLFRRAMGGAGKTMIKAMILFQDPSWVRALAFRPRDLAEMIVALESLEGEMESEAGQAEIADAYVESLKIASSSCEERTWPDTCRKLEQSLAAWGGSEI